MQILANGLVSGLMIALAAVAFAVVYLPTRVMHIGLGGVYAATPYLAWTLLRADMPWIVAIAAALAGGAILSWLCEKVNHGLLEKRSSTTAVHFVAALGLYLVISEGTAVIWGSETKVLRTGIDRSLTIGPVDMTFSQLIACAVASALLICFFICLRKTKIGVQFRAMADNPVQFSLTGRDVVATRAVAFAASGFIASAAALATSYDLGFNYRTGLRIILLALVAVVIGGRGAFGGAVAGALFLGVVRAGVVWQFGARWDDAATFLILAVVLFIRPQGLFGQRQRLEAEG